MRIDCLQPTAFGAKARIKRADNKTHAFLYNEILDLVRDYKIPANFRTHEIELPSVTVGIYRKLNELKIRFKSK